MHVEVHAVDAGAGVVLDAQVNVLLKVEGRTVLKTWKKQRTEMFKTKTKETWKKIRFIHIRS